MTYTLIMVVCLTAEPTYCQTRERAIEASPDQTTAYLEAQSMIAVWLAEHTRHYLKSMQLLPGRGA